MEAEPIFESYRSWSDWWQREEKRLMIDETEKLYPTKCLKCVKSGLYFCRFWIDLSYGCGEYDREKLEEKIIELWTRK